MRPENRGLLFAWIAALLQHAKTLPTEGRDKFIQLELERLEKDFGTALVWESGKVILSMPLIDL